MERSVSKPVLWYETRVRVRYAETDQMGVVYHSNHFIWFEVGRVELLRQLGFSYKEMEREAECHIAVVEARCRYKAPAMYDDEVIVRTSVQHVRDTMIYFRYELRRAEDNEFLGEGETLHIVVDRQKKITRIPEKYLQLLRQAAGR